MEKGTKKTMKTFRSKYDDKQKENRKKYAGSMEMVTKQAMAEETNINNILRKYKLTGVLPTNSKAALANFGDFSKIPSYKESLEHVLAAQDMFSELPSAVRNRFRNDPGHLIEFLADKNNKDEAIRLGLIDKPITQPSKALKSPAKGSESPATTEGSSKSANAVEGE